MEPMNNTNSKLGLAQYAVRPDEEEEDKLPTTNTYIPAIEPAQPAATGLARFAVKEAPKLTKQDVIANPNKMQAIRDYSTSRWGTDYQTLPDDQVVDDFVSHMRWVNTNEVSTAGELRAAWSADDATKAKFGEAYKVYDELGSVFSNDGVGGAIGGLTTYTAAVLTSPSTYLGGLIGRAASKATTKAAQVKVLSELSEAAIREATRAGGKKAAAVAPIQARKEIVTAATKHNLRLVVGAATATDVAVGVVQNKLYQDVMMETGVQEDYDYWSMAASGLAGVIGGGVAYIPEATRGVSGLADAASKITVAKKQRAARAAQNAAPDIKKMVDRIAADWKNMAAKGESVDPNLQLRTTAVDTFFDVDNEDSFVRILQRAGAEFNFEDNITLSHQLVEFAQALPKDVQDSLSDSLRPMNVTFGEMLDVFALTMRKAGQDQSKASIAKKFLKEYSNISVAKTNAQQGVVAGALKSTDDEAADPQTLGYMTSVWKRLLVSHPATTIVNVKGWGFAMAGRSMSEIVHGGVLGPVGLAKKMMKSSTADYTLAQSSALFKSQWFMAKTLMDPFTSVEAFSELLARSPKKIQKKALNTFFGGVGEGTPAMYGLSPDGMVTRNVEKLADAAADLSLVKVQDIYTKTFSGLKQLDIEARTEFGIGIDELLNSGRSHEVTDKMWDSALDAMLRDTFSQDYTHGKGILSAFAKLLEQTSNTPIAGFAIPFGRFMNNTVAFTMAYSPVGLLPLASKAYRKGATSMDIGQKISKAVVGSMALAYVTLNEEQKMQEGLQWYEERGVGGEVNNVGTVFPQSIYNLAGRIIAIGRTGEGVPRDLMDELKKQLGPLDAISNLGDNSMITDLIKYLGETSENEGEQNAFLDIINYAMSSISGTVLSGFTRPLDPYNDALGVALDAKGIISDVSVDRKQAEGMDAILLGLSRYTNSIFSLILGEEDETGRRLFGKPSMSATQEGPRRDPNPYATTFGTKVEPRRTNIDKVLGMVNLPPFRADSFTTGVPEYDAFMNDTVYATLERKATGLINSPTFKGASEAKKRDMVNAIIKDARYEILDSLEHNSVGSPNETLLNERRKIMVYDQSLRAEAKDALGITTDDRKLTLFQIQLIRDWIEVEKKSRQGELKQY